MPTFDECLGRESPIYFGIGDRSHVAVSPESDGYGSVSIVCCGSISASLCMDSHMAVRLRDVLLELFPPLGETKSP